MRKTRKNQQTELLALLALRRRVRALERLDARRVSIEWLNSEDAAVTVVSVLQRIGMTQVEVTTLATKALVSLVRDAIETTVAPLREQIKALEQRAQELESRNRRPARAAVRRPGS